MKTQPEALSWALNKIYGAMERDPHGCKHDREQELIGEDARKRHDAEECDPATCEICEEENSGTGEE